MNEAVRLATERLRAGGIESARREARVLWEHTHSVTGGVDGTFESAIARRLAHEPIAYITGEKEFWSLAFKVGPGALIPRPETETLIEGALREFSDREAPLSVLDLGTGSGCLLITFLMNYPKARGTGIDISEDALRWARANAAQHGVSTRSTFRRTDWAELGPAVYDVVLANPPYIPTEELEGLSPDVVRYEPHLALSGGMDGLDAYRALAQLLRTSLAPEGRAFLEIGQGQHHVVSQILESAGLQLARIVEDLAGIPRCVVAKAHPEARNTAK